MIYTVTLNPSLDYIISVDQFALGLTNRTSSELILPGGKGLNVSMVLGALGIENIALGFAAGFVGEEIKRELKEKNVTADFITVPEGNSRINIKLKSIDGTEINGMGPAIKPEFLQMLLNQLMRIKDGDILVLAGSIPATIPNHIYQNIMAALSDREVQIVVDATGELLMKTLSYAPFLIKPNNHELGALFGVELKTRESVIPYAMKLQEVGARNILVSMAGEGAVLITETQEKFSLPAPRGNLVNAVGAGDSMVAGFLAGYLEKQNYEYAFRMGLAAGSASAFSEYLATKDDIMKVYASIK